MGTIEIKGYAERKVNADTVEYYINFFSHERKVSEALKNSKEQCELFLSELKKRGFDISKIHLSEDKVDEHRYNDSHVEAEREIHFRNAFDPAFNNVINEIVHKNDLSVSISTEYSYSKKEELHEELISETTGQKVKYIDSVSDDGYFDYPGDETSYIKALVAEEPYSDDAFNELSGKELIESESICVTWSID